MSEIGLDKRNHVRCRQKEERNTRCIILCAYNFVHFAGIGRKRDATDDLRRESMNKPANNIASEV